MEGREACLTVVEVAGELFTAERRFFASAPTPVALVLLLELVTVRELAVPVGAAVRAAGVRGVALLVVVAGFLIVGVVDVVVGLVVVLDGDEVSPLGTTEERRAAEVIVDLFLSSSDTEGCDLWFVVEAGVAGFLTVVPPGGRVGGLLRVLPARAVALAVVLVAVVPGRRVVDVVVPGRFAGVEPPVLIEDAGDFVVVLGDAVIVSSLERTDSSCCTTSKPSESDMMAADRAWAEEQDGFGLAADAGFGSGQWH